MHKEITYKVIESTGCWECTSHQPDKDGYAAIRLDKKRIMLHRHMYSLINRPIDAGLVIRHTCDNTICINPEHLLVGTQHDNMMDMIARGRHLKKLSTQEVIDIREKYHGGGITQKKLAEMFGICRATVQDILKFRRHKYIIDSSITPMK